MKRILFVCKYNRFRSRVAEAYFKKMNKNTNYYVESAGLFQGLYPLNKKQVDVAAEYGIKLAGRPRAISEDLLRKQDIIVIVADNVPMDIFPPYINKKRIIKWEISDDKGNTDKEIAEIILAIKNKVGEFVRSLDER